jgi:hypothetical protein
MSLMVVVSGQFATDRSLADADLLGDLLLSLPLLVKRLSEVSLCQSQSFVGCHRLLGFVTLKLRDNLWSG